jgi:hypothetical protein
VATQQPVCPIEVHESVHAHSHTRDIIKRGELMAENSLQRKQACAHATRAEEGGWIVHKIGKQDTRLNDVDNIALSVMLPLSDSQPWPMVNCH